MFKRKRQGKRKNAKDSVCVYVCTARGEKREKRQKEMKRAMQV